MRHPLATTALSAWVVAGAACGSPTSPSPAATSTVTVTFGGLAVNNVGITSYTESGFTVSAVTSGWIALTTYGNPAPFIEFFAAPAATVVGEVVVTGGGSTFSFKSLDIYSSTTPIPYAIIGFRNSGTMFTVSGTQPNTFGGFATVLNSESADLIDTLHISLTNSAGSCQTCGNPMGFDNIVVVR